MFKFFTAAILAASAFATPALATEAVGDELELSQQGRHLSRSCRSKNCGRRRNKGGKRRGGKSGGASEGDFNLSFPISVPRGNKGSNPAPPSGSCGGSFQACCSGGGSPCDSGLRPTVFGGNSCFCANGDAGGGSTPPSSPPPSPSTPCGSEGDACCNDGDACDGDLVCINDGSSKGSARGVCVSVPSSPSKGGSIVGDVLGVNCGDTGQPCCSGGTQCLSSSNACVSQNGMTMCAACGAEGDFVCNAPGATPCFSGLIENNGRCISPVRSRGENFNILRTKTNIVRGMFGIMRNVLQGGANLLG